MTLNRWKFKGMATCGVAVVSFAAGSLLTARFMHPSQVRADENNVYELRVYHTVPGKVQALQSEFRDKVTKLFAKHEMRALGYWVPDEANTFVYILVHPNKAEAKEHWTAFQADPAFQEMIKSQQGDAKVVEKVDSIYMNPADFSPLQ